ncbi:MULTISPECIES: aldo/keto reductase [Luteococcus]|nr:MULTISPECIES: aldo/keto reductase [Luteococcus]MDN5562830.1 aldo/keto reductase [Luteococcus sp.]
MKTRQLGPFTVSAIGMGCMPLSMAREPRPSLDQAMETIHAALDAGITFFDTADIYAPSWDQMGHNEHVLAMGLRGINNRDEIVVATKGGITRGEGETWGRDGSKDYLRRALEHSLSQLEVDCIDLYQWHRPDRWKVYGEVVETFAEFKQQGLIKAIGISNANVEEIEIARDVLGPDGLVSVQNEFSPSFRCSTDTLTVCKDNGIAFLPWSPLGGCSGGATEVGSRFQAFGDVAREHGVSPQQMVLAWELAKYDKLIPIPGASRPESITDSAKAVDLVLSEGEMQRLDESPAWHDPQPHR